MNAYGSASMQTVGFVGEQDLGYAKTLVFTPCYALSHWKQTITQAHHSNCLTRLLPCPANPRAESYVKRANAYDAYLAGRVDIRYDFRMNRVVYLIKDGRQVVDAAGRSLDNIKPKWWRYGKSGNPFVCGASRVGIVLEDCASACSVSSFLSGVALLGTNLQDSHLPYLRKYDRLLVALDKDATKKALDLVRRLQAIRPTSLVVLNKDVKDMTDDERKRTFERYIP